MTLYWKRLLGDFATLSHMKRQERALRIQSILDQCTDPVQAFQNWMDRDVAFARRVAEDARARDLTVLTVDGTRTVEENAATVEANFWPPLQTDSSANSR